MSKAIICDICKKPIGAGVIIRKMKVKKYTLNDIKNINSKTLDVCPMCINRWFTFLEKEMDFE